VRILVLTDVLFPETVGGAGRVAYHICDQFSEAPRAGVRGSRVNAMRNSAEATRLRPLRRAVVAPAIPPRAETRGFLAKASNVNGCVPSNRFPC